MLVSFEVLLFFLIGGEVAALSAFMKPLESDTSIHERK